MGTWVPLQLETHIRVFVIQVPFLLSNFENSHNKSERKHKTQIFNNLLTAVMAGKVRCFQQPTGLLADWENTAFCNSRPLPTTEMQTSKLPCHPVSLGPHSHLHTQVTCFYHFWFPFSLPPLSCPCPSFQSPQVTACPALARHFEDGNMLSPLQPRDWHLLHRGGCGPVKHILEALSSASHTSP